MSPGAMFAPGSGVSSCFGSGVALCDKDATRVHAVFCCQLLVHLLLKVPGVLLCSSQLRFLALLLHGRDMQSRWDTARRVRKSTPRVTTPASKTMCAHMQVG